MSDTKQKFIDAVVKGIAELPDDHLLKRAVELARPKTLRGEIRWHVVGKVFGLGSTFSQQLCARYGIDPDALINKNGLIKDKQ